MCLLYTAKRRHKHQPAAASENRLLTCMRLGMAKVSSVYCEGIGCLCSQGSRERKKKVNKRKNKKLHLLLGQAERALTFVIEIQFIWV